jgi:hypothetical protein
MALYQLPILLLQRPHILTHLFINNLRIMLSRLETLMTQHLAHCLNRNAICQSHSRGEGMPSAVEGQFLGDAAEVCKFFKVAVHPLIAHDGQELTGSRGHGMVRVLVRDGTRNW